MQKLGNNKNVSPLIDNICVKQGRIVAEFRGTVMFGRHLLRILAAVDSPLSVNGAAGLQLKTVC